MAELTTTVRKWAFVLIHPSLPSRSEQIARARTWGLDDRGDWSAIVEDDISNVKRTTNWAGKMPNRTEFLKQLPKLWNVEVFFATPRCIGFSVDHAESTLREIWEAGAEVYVHSSAALYRAGDDISELLAAIASEQNAANVRAWRRRKSKQR